MKTIYVYYDGTFYTFKWLKALLWAKHELRDLGYVIKFNSVKSYLPLKHNFSSLLISSIPKSADYVLLAFHRKNLLMHNSEKQIIDILCHLKKYCQKLIWMDTSDSTGTTQFEFLPYVDLYFKKQFLKDLNEYRKPIWGGRRYAQYYHEKFGISSEGIDGVDFTPLDSSEIPKLRLSWNVGMGDLFANKYESFLRPTSIRTPRYRSPQSKQGFDIHYRGSEWPSAAGYQRHLVIDRLDELTQYSHPDPRERIDSSTYTQELKDAKIVVSPFGWGEICTRDFEAFAYGSLLLKPNMDNVDTFPNWYHPNQTYVSIDWDFSNFSQVLDDLTPEKSLEIAEYGQERFKKIRGDKCTFARHFAKELEK